MMNIALVLYTRMIHLWLLTDSISVIDLCTQNHPQGRSTLSFELRTPHGWLSQSHGFEQIRRKDCFWEICPHEAIIPQRANRCTPHSVLNVFEYRTL